MKKYAIFIVAFIVILLAGGYLWFEFGGDRDSAAVPTGPMKQVSLPVLPVTTEPNAYNGTLYTASEKLGSEFDVDSYMEGLNRNGVSWTAVYFGIEGNIGDKSVDFIKKVSARYPERITALYSTGIGGQSEGEAAGEKLTRQYTTAFEDLKKAMGDSSVAGIGEVEITAWPVSANDPKVKNLIDFASANNLAVMTHPKRGQLQEFGELIGAYPQTNFLMHHFRNDFTLERNQILALMKEHSNLFYTIDADHLMFSDRDKIGLLYKYQETDEDQAVAGFVADFDTMFEELITKSIQDYSPLVEAFPNRVMVGTEMSTDYSFAPQVYDRTIKMLRHFIGKLPTVHQEAIAYKNAQQFFGPIE